MFLQINDDLDLWQPVEQLAWRTVHLPASMDTEHMSDLLGVVVTGEGKKEVRCNGDTSVIQDDEFVMNMIIITTGMGSSGSKHRCAAKHQKGETRASGTNA